LYQFNKRINIF